MQPTWMSHAWAHFGVLEAKGAANNPAIVAFYRDAGNAGVREDSVPWCAAYVGACLKRAGLPNTGSLMARSYLKYGDAVSEPRWGDIAVFSRGSNPAAGHVGFLVGYTARTVFVLGGNQGDAVNVAAIPKARLLGYRRPNRQAEPEPPNERSAFEPCLAHVLKMEGGYTNDPHDPGGPTNYGITLAAFARHRGAALTVSEKSWLTAQLKEIEEGEVRAIYRQDYWLPSRAATMPPGVDLMHFDASVNHGLFGAAELLQGAVGVEVDGEIGPITLGAIARADPQALIAAYAEARARRYRQLHHFWRFGRGWLRRVEQTRTAAIARLKTASTALGQSSVTADRPTGAKPMVEAASQAPDTGAGAEQQAPASTQVPATKWWGQSLTIRGALLTALTTVVPVIAPLFGFNVTADMVDQVGTHATAIIQAVAALVGIAMTIFGRVRASQALTRRPVQLRV